MRRICCFWKVLLLTVLAAAVLPCRPAAAAEPSFTFRTDRQSASAGDTVSLSVTVSHACEVAGFRLRIAYDSSALQFAGVTSSPQIEPGTLQTNEQADPICSVYVCNVGKGHAPALSGTVLTYRFVVSGRVTGTSELCACVDETCDFAGKDMRLDTFRTCGLSLLPAEDAATCLTVLEPSVGELEPSFSPDIHAYRMQVGAEVGTVVFRVDAPGGESVAVSRKTLLAAGSSTPVVIIVTSQDGKTKSVYTVMIDRDAKKAGGTVSSSPFSGSRAGKNSKAEAALAAARKGKVPETASGTASGRSGAAASVPASASAAVTQTAAQAAPLVIVQNQMPAFLVGMLAAGFCIVTGILLSVWFRQKKQ